ncbi:MAG: protein kinase [Myxococcaceae bacterium]|nr:protein kinase [Myxococcaceae bacterium]
MAESGPQQFGKYVLLSRLAAGGMAVTFRARMTGAAGVTKPCVIKQILPHFADDHDFVQMFISEARVAMSLTHGNIAQLFDFGEVDGQYFIALEFVHGQPLSKVLRRAIKTGVAFFPIPLALHVISKLCDGLDYAHRQVGEDGLPLGLVHRDVSPDNVLISYEGEVKVIDFGIAKATSLVEQKTSPGVVKGKYPYFSPEQAQGRQDLDARTDVYAAGVMLYEAVCGRRPYEGEFVAVLPRIMVGDYTPPSQVNPAISPELEDIIAKALAIRREDRFQTAKALSEALVGLLYRENPGFTPSLLSQLVAHLFTEELSAEGRRVELPPTFAEQLAAWQAPDPNLTLGRPRLSSPGTPRTPGGGSRTPSGSGRGNEGQRPPSGGGARPPSDGGPRTPNSTGARVATTGLRRVTSQGNGRRVTHPGGVPTSGVRRALGGERSGPPLPDAPPRRASREDSTPAEGLPSLISPVDAQLEDSTLSSRSAAAAHHTPIETPALTQPARGADPLAAVRADKARKEEELAARRQKLVRNISLGIFAVVAIMVLYVVLRPPPPEAPPPATTIWVTSTPSGATVKLNNRDVRGKTPLFVDGFIVDEANTLVLTLPGHLAWTKRFTPSGRNDPAMHAELKPSDTPDEPALPVAPLATRADAGTGAAEGDGAESAIKPEEELDYNEVVYPTRLLVLRTIYNALPIPEYTTASIELNPGTSYAVNTEGGAAYAAGGPTSNTLVYFLEGELPADDSFGLLTGATRVIRGARRMHVFALDETPLSDNRGTVRVQLSESKWKPPRYLTFDAQKHAVWLKREHQVWLHGLNPKSTYLFTVRDDFAELRKDGRGRIRRALCFEPGTNPTTRPTYRIFETGKRYQLNGMEMLRCTFPDMRVSDNEGALEVDLVDVTNMTRKEREEYIRNTRFDR